MSPIAGELVTEALDFDGGRQVTVYVPPDPAEAVVFAADGAWHTSRLSEVLEGASAPPTMIVGVHGMPDDDGRLHEYVPGFDAERFATHERFFVDDVGRWVESRFGVALPTDRTGVWGASLGGEPRSPWGFAIRTCTAQSSRRRLAPASSRRRYCRARCHASTSSLAARSSPSSTTRGGGRTRWAMQAQTCHDAAGRRARRRVLGGRVPVDGGVGVRVTVVERNCRHTLDGRARKRSSCDLECAPRWAGGVLAVMSLGYATEHLTAAVCSLAVSEDPLAERLQVAWDQHVQMVWMKPCLTHDLLREFRDLWQRYTAPSDDRRSTKLRALTARSRSAPSMTSFS